jgi:hypothetical protein
MAEINLVTVGGDLIKNILANNLYELHRIIYKDTEIQRYLSDVKYYTLMIQDNSDNSYKDIYYSCDPSISYDSQSDENIKFIKNMTITLLKLNNDHEDKYDFIKSLNIDEHEIYYDLNKLIDKYPELFNDCNLMLIIAKNCGQFLEYASEDLKNNFEIVLAAVNNYSDALEYASEDLKNNFEIVLAAVNNNGNALEYASKELKDNYEIILSAVKTAANGEALEYASKELKDNYEIVLAAVKKNGEALEYASYKFRNNFEIVLEAVKNNGEALEYASEELINDFEIVLVAVKNNGDVLRFVSEELRNNYEIVLAAVINDGHALLSASEELKNNYEIVLAAVNNEKDAWRHASEELGKIDFEKELKKNGFNRYCSGKIYTFIYLFKTINFFKEINKFCINNFL